MSMNENGGRETAEHYRRVAAAFSERVDAVPLGAWDNDAPCDGWVARDVVRHMVEWMGGMVAQSTELTIEAGPSVDDDPAGAWHVFDDQMQALLVDPELAASEFFHEYIGRMPLEQAVAMVMIPDVFLHAWDLARATGLDETLDPDEVAGLYAGMEPLDEMLRQSGQYGPRVAVPDDADAQTKLLAFIGRHP
jgi:uncharacterized protein (TIGR03086 family)